MIEFDSDFTVVFRTFLSAVLAVFDVLIGLMILGE